MTKVMKGKEEHSYSAISVCHTHTR